MHKKAVCIISLFCVLTFGHSLFNDFTGDDFSFIKENNFYQKVSNLPYLFSSKYITKSDDVYNRDQTAIVTGSVAYRPVVSLSYFIDYAVWGVNPFGYHLTNFFLHLLNSLLVYFCLFSLFEKYFRKKNSRDWETSLLSAVIFCVHPLKVEPVCSIGYRADLLATFFVLFSFLLHVNLRKSNGWHRIVKVVLSHSLFFLGLFSKESVIVYPGILVALNWSARVIRKKESFLTDLKRLRGYFLVLLFYLFVYFFIMPNSSLKSLQWIGGDWRRHILAVLYFVTQYITALILPYTVKMLPPVYSPPLHVLWGPRTGFYVSEFFLFLGGCFFLVRRRNIASFALMWFVIGLIPVLNIIPLANPFAYRFMYFPSFGICVLLGLLFSRRKNSESDQSPKRKFLQGLKLTYVAMCIIVSFFLVFAWRNNFIASKNMIRDFPESPVGYLMMSIQYEKSNFYPEARKMARRAIELGVQDPRAYYVLALVNEKEPKKAMFYYKKCLRLYPEYAPCLTGLGKMYLMQGDYVSAKETLEKSINISSSFSAYFYLLQTTLLDGNFTKADELYQEACSLYPDAQQKEILQKVYTLYDQDSLPLIFL